MIISTPRTDAPPRARRTGFTLVEVMVSAAISVFILAGILGAFVMIGRTGFRASSYSELESESRRGLDVFGQDVRKAADIKWNSNQSITLSVTTSTNATVPVTYAYDSSTNSATAGCFYRVLGDAESTQPRRILIHRVGSDFAFHRYKLENTNSTGGDNTAATDLETKQIEVTIHASRTGSTVVAANHTTLSARYILRNKRVSN